MDGGSWCCSRSSKGISSRADGSASSGEAGVPVLHTLGTLLHEPVQLVNLLKLAQAAGGAGTPCGRATLVGGGGEPSETRGSGCGWRRRDAARTAISEVALC